MTKFESDIRTAINCNSAENGSNTPDFILATYLADCLEAFDKATRQREAWYGRDGKPGAPPEFLSSNVRCTVTHVDAPPASEG